MADLDAGPNEWLGRWFLIREELGMVNEDGRELRPCGKFIAFMAWFECRLPQELCCCDGQPEMDWGVCWFHPPKLVIVGIDLLCVINGELWGTGLLGWWFIVVVMLVGPFILRGCVITGVFGKWMPLTGWGIAGCTKTSSTLAGDQNVVEVAKSWNMEFSESRVKFSFVCSKAVFPCVEITLDFGESSKESSHEPFLIFLLSVCSSLRFPGKKSDVVRESLWL